MTPRLLTMLAVLMASLSPDPAKADCTDPPGIAGQILYNADHRTPQFCDGAIWWAMKSGGGLPSCSEGDTLTFQSGAWECARAGCPDGYTSYSTGCYKLVAVTGTSWDDARTACQADGGDLVVINDATEFANVNAVRGTADIWIGLSDTATEGTWSWINSSSFSPQWGAGEPNGGTNENCAGMFEVFSGDFGDDPCGNSWDRICER